MLGKGVYPYDYINNCERFNKKKLLPIEKFYNGLHIEYINDADYKHGNIRRKGFKINNLGEHAQTYQLMYQKPFATNALRYINLIQHTFFQYQNQCDKND